VNHYLDHPVYAIFTPQTYLCEVFHLVLNKCNPLRSLLQNNSPSSQSTRVHCNLKDKSRGRDSLSTTQQSAFHSFTMASASNATDRPLDQPWQDLVCDMIAATENALDGGLKLADKDLETQLAYWQKVFQKFRRSLPADDSNNPYLTDPPALIFDLFFDDSINPVDETVEVGLSAPDGEAGILKRDLVSFFISHFYGHARWERTKKSVTTETEMTPWILNPDLVTDGSLEEGEPKPALIYGMEWTDDGSEWTAKNRPGVVFHICTPEEFRERKTAFESVAEIAVYE
jgi:hypothetical protein